MNYIVLDLEATCWEKKNRRGEHEIIEIGALMFNQNGELLGEFAEFIRPVRNPILSEFCVHLTTIQQKDVDEARSFPEVVRDFQSWFGMNEHPYLLCSWGFYDKAQLEKDCNQHGLDNEWLRFHISLKHQYPRLARLPKRVGMGKALDLEGFELEGTHHRGIDDARNISKIFTKYLGQWVV